MLPSIVLVIGIMLFWNAIYKVIPLYDTIWYHGAGVCGAVSAVHGAVRDVRVYADQREPSCRRGERSAARPAYVFRRVTLPMISRGIFAGWMMIFIIAFRELVTASLIAPPNTLVVSTYINREFEQGSVSLGMAMAVLCVLITTTALLIFNHFTGKAARGHKMKLYHCRRRRRTRSKLLPREWGKYKLPCGLRKNG